MQYSCACHLTRCLGAPRLVLTAPHTATALGLHYGPGQQCYTRDNSQPALTESRVSRQRMGSRSALSNASQPVVMPGTNAWQPSASSTSLPSGSVYRSEMNASVIFWASPTSNSRCAVKQQ